MAGEATSAAGGGPGLRTRSGLITKGYRKLGVGISIPQEKDFENNSAAVLPKDLPDSIGKKGPIIMKIKDGYGVEISIPQEAAP